MLNKVTITGADDTTRIEQLVQLSKQFPFVEWGILLSKNSAGTPRYPTSEWLYNLASVKKDEPLLKLSAHVCGHWSRDFIRGGQMVLDDLPHLLYAFDRIQLNFSVYHDRVNMMELGRIMRQLGHQFIIQITENPSITLIRSLQCLRLDVVGLHDLSGGLGVLPVKWRSPLKPYCGYAGGLGPDNLRDQLSSIKQVSRDVPSWIDMESNIRTDDRFDLDKVKACLGIAEGWIQ